MNASCYSTARRKVQNRQCNLVSMFQRNLSKIGLMVDLICCLEQQERAAVRKSFTFFVFLCLMGFEFHKGIFWQVALKSNHTMYIWHLLIFFYEENCINISHLEAAITIYMQALQPFGANNIRSFDECLIDFREKILTWHKSEV